MKVLMPDLMRVELNARVLQEARSLAAHGYSVEVAGFSNVDRARQRVIQGIECHSWFLSDRRRTLLDKVGRWLSALRLVVAINGFILSRKAAVYHAHNFHTLPAAVLSARIHRGKVIYDTHETWTIHRHGGFHFEHFAAQVCETLFLRFADGFVTVNEMVRDFYCSKYGVSDGLVLYNTHPLQPVVRNRWFHEELGLRQDQLVVLFQGGFYDRLRGIEELIAATPMLDEKAVVVFLGFGPVETIEKMRGLAKKHGVEGRVFIVPPKEPDRVLACTMSADVGMNLITRAGPAQDFQSPWKLFEYCMAGLPVVSTDLPFHRMVHECYDIGPLCPRNNDPAAIAKLVNNLLRDEGERRRLGNNARKAAESEFCWERQEEKLLTYYEKLLSRNQGGSKGPRRRRKWLT